MKPDKDSRHTPEDSPRNEAEMYLCGCPECIERLLLIEYEKSVQQQKTSKPIS